MVFLQGREGTYGEVCPLMFALTVASNPSPSRAVSPPPRSSTNSPWFLSRANDQSLRSRTNLPPLRSPRCQSGQSAPEPPPSPNYICLHTLTRLSSVTTFSFTRLRKMRSFFFPYHRKPIERGRHFSATYALDVEQKMINSSILITFHTRWGGGPYRA
jgi:hypothetical protein